MRPSHAVDAPTASRSERLAAATRFTYRVRLGQCDPRAGLSRETPGVAVIAGDSRSLLGRFARWLGAILRRELSF